MKFYKFFAVAALLISAAMTSCKDEDQLAITYLGEPWTCTEPVVYTVSEDKQINDSTTVKVDVEYTRQRPTLCAKVPAGDHDIAYTYGFCWNTAGNPDVNSNVIQIDETWSDAVLGLQKGILKDTTFVNIIPDAVVYVRAFLVTYPDGEIIYSGQSEMVEKVIKK